MRAVVGVVGTGLGMVVKWRAVAGAGPEVGWISGGQEGWNKVIWMVGEGGGGGGMLLNGGFGGMCDVARRDIM